MSKLCPACNLPIVDNPSDPLHCSCDSDKKRIDELEQQNSELKTRLGKSNILKLNEARAEIEQLEKQVSRLTSINQGCDCECCHNLIVMQQQILKEKK